MVMVTGTNVTGAMKMGNVVPRVGIKHRSLAFQANVLTITSSRLPGVTTVPTPTCLCSSLFEKSVLTTTYLYSGNPKPRAPTTIRPSNDSNYYDMTSPYLLD